MKKPAKKTKADLAREAEEAFRKMNERWDRVGKFAGKYSKPDVVAKPTKPKPGRYSASEIAAAEAELQSLGALEPTKVVVAATQPGRNKYAAGVGAVKPAFKYTGTKILGVATMHKSSAVPVFSDEEAKDIAKMRRG